jgi:hypothetical protein
MPRYDEDLASIDELLTAAEPDGDPAPTYRRRRSGGVRWLVKAVLQAAVLAAFVYAVLVHSGVKVPYPLLFAGFFALFALGRAVRAVAAERPVIGGPLPAVPALGGVNPDDLADGVLAAMSRWDSRLAYAERDPQRFDSTVRPRLGEIADERLRQRHGLTRASDPRRAREIMGERLWTFLYSPLARTPNRRELAGVVDDMEKL